jgi:hypothetical protein
LVGSAISTPTPQHKKSRISEITEIHFPDSPNPYPPHTKNNQNNQKNWNKKIDKSNKITNFLFHKKQL